MIWPGTGWFSVVRNRHLRRCFGLVRDSGVMLAILGGGLRSLRIINPFGPCGDAKSLLAQPAQDAPNGLDHLGCVEVVVHDEED
jgi:hypothetical protein